MVGTSGSEANKADKMRVYVETDLDTALLLTPSQSSTVKALQDSIEQIHQATYPEAGKVTCKRLTLTAMEGKSFALDGSSSIRDLSESGQPFRIQAVFTGKAGQPSAKRPLSMMETGGKRRKTDGDTTLEIPAVVGKNDMMRADDAINDSKPSSSNRASTHNGLEVCLEERQSDSEGQAAATLAGAGSPLEPSGKFQSLPFRSSSNPVNANSQPPPERSVQPSHGRVAAIDGSLRQARAQASLPPVPDLTVRQGGELQSTPGIDEGSGEPSSTSESEAGSQAEEGRTSNMLSQLDVVPETQPISIQQVPGISGAEGSHQQSDDAAVQLRHRGESSSDAFEKQEGRPGRSGERKQKAAAKADLKELVGSIQKGALEAGEGNDSDDDDGNNDKDDSKDGSSQRDSVIAEEGKASESDDEEGNDEDGDDDNDNEDDSNKEDSEGEKQSEDEDEEEAGEAGEGESEPNRDGDIAEAPAADGTEVLTQGPSTDDTDASKEEEEDGSEEEDESEDESEEESDHQLHKGKVHGNGGAHGKSSAKHAKEAAAKSAQADGKVRNTADLHASPQSNVDDETEEQYLIRTKRVTEGDPDYLRLLTICSSQEAAKRKGRPYPKRQKQPHSEKPAPEAVSEEAPAEFESAAYKRQKVRAAKLAGADDNATAKGVSPDVKTLLEKPLSSYPLAREGKLELVRNVKEALREQMAYEGKPKHKLFSQEQAPVWWPLEKWDHRQVDSKTNAVKVLEAMRSHYGID